MLKGDFELVDGVLDSGSPELLAAGGNEDADNEAAASVTEGQGGGSRRYRRELSGSIGRGRVDGESGAGRDGVDAVGSGSGAAAVVTGDISRSSSSSSALMEFYRGGPFEEDQEEQELWARRRRTLLTPFGQGIVQQQEEEADVVDDDRVEVVVGVALEVISPDKPSTGVLIFLFHVFLLDDGVVAQDSSKGSCVSAAA